MSSANGTGDSDSTTEGAPKETATWTNYLPQAFGVREAIRQSPYRWCARESAMWGIATGTAMGIHRLRMGSTPYFCGNIAFGTMFCVFVPSYYFCCKRRNFKEQWIELMMRANDIQGSSQMPAQPREDPFLADYNDIVAAAQQQGGEGSSGVQPEEGSGGAARPLSDQELYGRLQERKEWQTQTPTQDANQVFAPVASPKDDPRPQH